MGAGGLRAAHREVLAVVTRPQTGGPLPAEPGAPRVLVVEDHPDLRLLLESTLRRAGFIVVATSSGGEALAVLEGQPVDLVVLDLGLPGMDGHELLRRIRAHSELPVIVVTGHAEQAERVAAFEQGADDYLLKPFSQVELVARVRAVLRRAAPRPKRPTLHWGRLRIDTRARQVLVDDREVSLTVMEYELLRFLAANPRLAVSRQELLRAVWPTRGDWQDPETVTEHVRRLRLKLAEAGLGGEWIATIRGFGYRFDPPSA
jgi:DNA-binding response OmpR family regulator